MGDILIITEHIEIEKKINKYFNNSLYKLVNYKYYIEHLADFRGAELIIYDMTALDNPMMPIAQLQVHHPFIPIVCLVKSGDVQTAVGAVQAGAVNVLALPLDKQSLLQSIQDAISDYEDFNKSNIIINQAIELLQSLRQTKLPQNIPSPKPELIMPDASEKNILQFGDLILNLQRQTVFYQKKPLDLTPTQFKLLAYLGLAKGQIVPFEELYAHLHGIEVERSVARTSLSAHLSYLRTKLRELGCEAYLENIRGRGYIFDTPEEQFFDSPLMSLEFILEQLPVILWTTDNKLRITAIYGSGLGKIGLKPDEVIGMTPEKFFQSDFSRLPIGHSYQKALHGKASTFEQIFANRVLHVYMAPTFSNKGEVIGCIGLAFDITERKEAEKNLSTMG